MAEEDNANVQVHESVEGLRGQLVAMEAAIEGQTSSSIFRPKTLILWSWLFMTI